MPEPLNSLTNSPAQLFQDQQRCFAEEAANTAPSAGATAPVDNEVYSPQANGEVHASLLKKYELDLSAFRQASAPPSPAPGAAAVIAHDPEACNQAVRDAALNCLDAVGNVLQGIDAARNGGSIGDIGTGIHIGTAAMRCFDSSLAAYDACHDRDVP